MLNEVKTKMTEENTINPGDYKYSLFLGCVIPNRYPMIEKATREVMKNLNVELIDMEGASCCPAPGVFRSIDTHIWNLLGARNITIAEQNKADIVTLCNGCYGTLLEVNHNLQTEEKLKDQINNELKEIGKHYDGSVKVKQVMEVLYYDIGLEKLKPFLKKKLGLKVAVHYGCHLLSPSSIRPYEGEFEVPRFFDELVEATGCESVEYNEKMLCCGAGGGVRSSFRDVSLEFTHQKLHNMRDADADCVCVCCPFCELQFDLGQMEINQPQLNILDPDEQPYEIPVIFITQLVGLSMGLTPEEVGLVKNKKLQNVSPFISNDKLLEKIKEKINGEPTEEAKK